MQSQSSLRNFQKLQRKISFYLQRQKTADITLSEQKSISSAQKIPQKFIVKNHLISSEKKITPNKKFQWLTKSVENSRETSNLSTLISHKSSMRQSFKKMGKNHSKTDTLIQKSKSHLGKNIFSSSQKENKEKAVLVTEFSMFDLIEKNSLSTEIKLQISEENRLIGQQNCLQLLKEIQINHKITKSLKDEKQSFKNKFTKENNFLSKQNEQNLQKVLLKENRKNSFVKRKRSLQSEIKNEQDFSLDKKLSEFLVSGFKPRAQNNEKDFFKTPLSNKINVEDSQSKGRKCIKNLKKEYIHLSKEEKKQKLFYLKRMHQDEKDLKIEPWNFLKQEFQEAVYGVIGLK